VAVPDQPTLRDGEVVLRPWTAGDVDAARLASAAAVFRWREPYADGRRVVNFLVEHAGQPAGSVEVRQVGDGRGELSWAVSAAHRGAGVGVRAVRLLMRYAFEELALLRLEAYVDPANRAALRLAARTGMRREGVLRRRESVGGQRRDHVLLARLADDLAPNTRDGFIEVLNATLPTKRVIAQGLLRNPRGQVLLCELTYKGEWDLPGGVVEPGESPANGVVREVREELGLEVAIQRLVTVNWLPPWRGWDDACAFVFDLGTVADDTPMTLQPSEIVAVHWCNPGDVAARASAATATMLAYLAATPRSAPYLEIGAEPPPR